MSIDLKKIGGLNKAIYIKINAPIDAVYWDTVDSTYVKNFNVNQANEFEWQYLSKNGEWCPCNGEKCPVQSGDFIKINDIPAFIPNHQFTKPIAVLDEPNARSAKTIKSFAYKSDNEILLQQQNHALKDDLTIWRIIALAAIGALFAMWWQS